MLKLSDMVREFPIVLKTDRDCENPLVTEFVKEHGPFDSLLDVGCHSSANHYAPEIRKYTQIYDGIDILEDVKTAQILDHYFVGNFNTHPLVEYDIVICVSTLEHAGISTYQADYLEERMKLFNGCLDHAKKYVWISFPVGQEYTYPGELSIVTENQLNIFEELLSIENYKFKERFFYSQGPQANFPWYEHQKREVAVKIPYIDYVGNSSIAVLEIDKT